MGLRGRCFQFAVATAGALALTMHGSIAGWTSPVLPKLRANDSYVPITSGESSWLASVNSLTSLLGSLCVALTAPFLGRKILLLSTVVPTLINWFLIAFADSFGMLLAARLIAGLTMGMVTSVCPMYLGEIGEKEIRGALSSFYQVMMNGGILYAYCTGSFLSVSTAALVDMAIPALFLVTFVWAPESPYFYMQRGKEKEAIKALLKLRQESGVADVEEELEQTRKAIAQQQETRGSLKDLFLQRGNRRTLLIMCGLAILQVTSGSIALMTYATDIFASSGSTLDASTCSIIVMVVQLVASAVSVPLLDVAGRRPLLVWSFLGCALANIVEGVYFFLADVQNADVSALYWLPLTTLIAFQVIFSLGVGAVLYVLVGEIFHVSVKGLSSSVISVTMSLTAFLVQKLYQVVVDAVSPAYPFWAFGAFCVCGSIYTYFFVPETKGKTFAEINQHMNGEIIAEKLPS